MGSIDILLVDSILLYSELKKTTTEAHIESKEVRLLIKYPFFSRIVFLTRSPSPVGVVYY